MEQLIIEEITIGDVSRLQLIARDTFLETFAEVNTEADMKHYLDESLSVAKLSEEIKNEGSKFFFAVINDAVAGYLKINTGQAQTELKNSGALEIERIYVAKAYQGKNIGQLLFNHAITMAEGLPANYVWLGVWEYNAKAIRFYTKNGFAPFDKHVFKLGSDVQTDIMMKKHL